MTGAIPAGPLAADRVGVARVLGVAEQRRVARPDGDAGDGDATDLGEHRRRVVAAPPARPGDDQHQVGFVGAAADLGRERVRVVRLDLAHQSAPRRADGTARRA